MSGSFFGGLYKDTIIVLEEKWTSRSSEICNVSRIGYRNIKSRNKFIKILYVTTDYSSNIKKKDNMNRLLGHHLTPGPSMRRVMIWIEVLRLFSCALYKNETLVRCSDISWHSFYTTTICQLPFLFIIERHLVIFNVRGAC